MKRWMTSLSVASVALMASSGALAQQSGLQQCATIEDSLERLVCYDNLAEQQAEQGQMKQDNHGQQVSQQARQKGQQMREQHAQNKNKNKGKGKGRGEQQRDNAEDRFGMEHKNAGDMEQIDRITVQVDSRRQDPYGNWIIELDNGQVWKQTENVGYFSWDDNDTYYIERGAFNSFFFGREGVNRRFRVTRIE